MFRRKPPGRRPGRQGRKSRQAALRALRRAHRLMEAGQYEQAFPVLKRLADGAARHGMLVKAAHLYLQAAHARLEMGSAPDAVELADRAVQLLVNAGQVGRIRSLLPRMIRALEEKGHHDQAVVLRAEVEALLGGERPAPPLAQRGALPAKCLSCNGPLRADQVEWIDHHSAECVYCGSVVQTL